MVQGKKSLFFVFLFLLLVVPVQMAWAAPKCEIPQKTRININPDTSKVAYDYTRNLKNIQKTKTDTVDPYGIHSNSITQGFMEGQISMQRQVDLDYYVVGNKDYVCIWYKTIDVNVHIDPKIVIAKEIKRDKCMHKAVLEHETKHVHVDRDVVNEAAHDIAKSIYGDLTETGFILGPVPAKKAQIYAEAMVKRVMDVTQDAYDRMIQDRTTRQAGIDTLEEYQRVSAECPSFYQHKKLLYGRALSEKNKRAD